LIIEYYKFKSFLKFLKGKFSLRRYYQINGQEKRTMVKSDWVLEWKPGREMNDTGMILPKLTKTERRNLGAPLPKRQNASLRHEFARPKPIAANSNSGQTEARRWE